MWPRRFSSASTASGSPSSRCSTPPSVITVPVGSLEPVWCMRIASPASWRFMPKSTRFTTICAWPCGCMSPPIRPNASTGTPAWVMNAGMMVWNGRFPGAYELGLPGFRLNRLPRSWMPKPSEGIT